MDYKIVFTILYSTFKRKLVHNPCLILIRKYDLVTEVISEGNFINRKSSEAKISILTLTSTP